MRAHIERINDELANGRTTALADFGTIYAYQVADDIYEIDWELTTVPSGTVEVLALAAHLDGQKLPCQLVPPRPRRGDMRIKPQPVLQVAEPVPYGQLRLPL